SAGAITCRWRPRSRPPWGSPPATPPGVPLSAELFLQQPVDRQPGDRPHDAALPGRRAGLRVVTDDLAFVLLRPVEATVVRQVHAVGGLRDVLVEDLGQPRRQHLALDDEAQLRVEVGGAL